MANNLQSEKYTIKDLENLSGIKAHTLRIWEQRYSIIKPNRTNTNIRYYNGQQLKKILNVSLLNKYGFKISHIDKMSEDEIQQKVMGISVPEAQQEKIIHSLIKAMVDLDMEAFEEILGSFIAARGVEKAVLNILFPYLEKIGMLWLTNHINPAQEHLVSNIIRQKLILAISNTTPAVSDNKKVLMFLPEGEYHELTLLFLHYMVRRRGANVIYLGCSIPLKDVAFVAQALKPDFLYTHLTNSNSRYTAATLATNILKAVPDVPLVISGKLASGITAKTSPKLQVKKSLQEVLNFVNSL